MSDSSASAGKRAPVERRKSRRGAFYALAILLLYLTAEGAGYAALRVLAHVDSELAYAPIVTSLSPEQKQTVAQHVAGAPSGGRIQHPVLGWVTGQERTWHDGMCTSNAQGLRGSAAYALQPPAGVVRVSAFGDSFTFGDEVADDGTWEAQLTARDPRFEVLNFGVTAYGLDQSYLRYLEQGTSFGAHVVVIGFMSENLFRQVNVFRPFYKAQYKVVLPKPRFSFRGGELALLANPLPSPADLERLLRDEATVLRELGENDHFFRVGYEAGPFDVSPLVRLVKVTAGAVRHRMHPILTRDGIYDEESEAFAVTREVLKKFHRAALDHDSLPLIVIYPNRRDLARHTRGEARRYGPLLSELRSSGYLHLDLLDAFAAQFPGIDPRDLVKERGHYSVEGNRIVAEAISDCLERHGFDDAAGVRDAVERERARVPSPT